MGLGASWKRLVGVLLPMFSVLCNVFSEPLLGAFYCGDDKCHAFRARLFLNLKEVCCKNKWNENLAKKQNVLEVFCQDKWPSNL